MIQTALIDRAMHVSKTRFWLLELLLILALMSGSGQRSCVAAVVELGRKAVAAEPFKDSLTERGSYNFSDLGDWIWAAEVADRQTVRFWKSFEIPHAARVTKARLRITGDNEYVLFLDGQEIGRDAEWRHLYEYDLTALLKPGRHVLAVQGYNSSREAGMLFGLRAGLTDGQVIGVKSDESWRLVPEDVSGWQKRTEAPAAWPQATVVGKLGSGFWGIPDTINLVPPLAPILIPFWKTGWFQLTLLSVCGIVTLISFRLLAQVILQKKEQQLLHRERARIARDIHDDVGTRMTQIVLQGEVALSEQSPGTQTHAQLDRISEEAREVLHAMDEILWAINPRRDTLHEFATYVCGFAQTFLKPTNIQCLLDVEPDLSTVAFDLPLRRNLLLAIKEALNNAAKYSEATELWLHIRRQGPGLNVVVQDNGQGFDPARIDTSRNGLTNMVQRMNEVGGRCVVTSEPGQGCRVEFSLPFTQMRRRSWWRLWRTDQPSVRGAPAPETANK
jgi:signal transduction histidine kinase